ncbi:uncharacterized protein GGS22DRAFT_192544 [Annulohypoxylon maeteangense]|uniref:uncharacterized protein n=1 Tax=Annulohypoxylon maeteangense TaxID=1927788 RepID=UPI00200830F4|nr:uncharacterized protein GGS22DRAFT_192544 [Annulohypoxylon maeteangense]KAI0881058.1 hypothetical protein GGS22DRAFT_192544 [Annulohypoxylon maeteangense]
MAVEQRRLRGLQDSAASLDAALTASPEITTGTGSTSNPAPSSSHPTPRAGRKESIGDEETDRESTLGSMSSPPPLSETSQTRSTRSTSTTSRNSNRLSLTLPIAQPNSFPSRPTPTSSMPPTPIETSALSSPTDPNDFIVAIAAQERRVLELREELGRAEDDLRKLKRQWTSSAAYRKRASHRNVEPLQAMESVLGGPWGYDENVNVRYNSELERRKAILRAQSQGTPRESKRTVIRGGHARTLSLLSPTRSTNGDDSGLRSADPYSKPPSITSPAPINKRATWAPRQTQQYQPTDGMKKMANELKQGLWTFVEDLRQATVGDEAISGTTHRTSEMISRLGRMEGDQDTIRASASSRGRIPFQDEPESILDSPSIMSTDSFSDRFQHRRTTSKAEPKAKKHFSWTPLTFDSFDDEDWSNWESPNVKTSRWSGSTVNGDIISAIPERTNENGGTLRRKQSRSELRPPSPQTPSKLEELPQAILNRLAPSNLKNTTSNFIKEWEKSLSPPAESTSF